MPIVNNDAIDFDLKSWQGKSIRDRFEAHYHPEPNTGCFIWDGSTRSNNKCGALRLNKFKFISAHRLSYLLFKGQIPENYNVLHTCDNPLCVNPNHLFLGTQLDNIKDRDKKQRQRNRYSIKQLGKASGREGGK